MPSSNSLLDLLTTGLDPNNPLGLTAAAPGYLPPGSTPQRDPDLGWSDGMQPGYSASTSTPFSSLPADVQNSANAADINWANMDQGYYAPREQDPTPLVLGALGAIAAPFALSAFGLGGAAAGAAGTGADALVGSAGADVLGGAAAAGAGATTVSDLVVTAAASGLSPAAISAALGIPAATVGAILSSSGGGGGNTLAGAGDPAATTVDGVTVTPGTAPSTAGLTPLPLATAAGGLDITQPGLGDTSGLTSGTPSGDFTGGSDFPAGALTPIPTQTSGDGTTVIPPVLADTSGLTGGTPSGAGIVGGTTGGTTPFNPTSLIGPAIGAAGTIAGALTQAGAADHAADVEQNIWNQTQTNLQPFINAGTGALPQLEALTGTGPGGIAGEEAALRQTPGYQFQMDEGLNALLSKSTATGGVGGGNTLKGLLGYSQGLADSTFQQQWGNTYNLATLGENAGAHLGSLGTTTGSNIANTLTQGANASSAGITGLTNQITGFLGTPAGQSFLAGLGQ